MFVSMLVTQNVRQYSIFRTKRLHVTWQAAQLGWIDGMILFSSGRGA